MLFNKAANEEEPRCVDGTTSAEFHLDSEAWRGRSDGIKSSSGNSVLIGMVFGFNKDKESAEQNNGDEATKILEKQGKDGQTLDNNVDPGRNKVNPQVISSDDFIINSLSYGMRVPTGRTSTWDRRLTPETETFHRKVLEKHRGVIKDHLETHRRGMEQRAQVYGQPLSTSINNYLVGEQIGTVEGQARPDQGRQRGRDTMEPSHHDRFHNPTVHDRLHGAANIVAGKLRADQDISTRGQAEFHGQTEDGH